MNRDHPRWRAARSSASIGPRQRRQPVRDGVTTRADEHQGGREEMSTQSGTDGGDRWTQAARPARRLTRRTNGKIVAGVAGGLADYLEIDAVLVRIVFVVLLFTGAGFLMYLVAWWLVPA